MKANVAVRNWRFLQKMGITGCRWFEGVGNYMDVRRLATVGIDDATISPDSPIVLTLKVLYAYPGQPTEEQGRRGRTEMLGTSFRDYEQRIREQFDAMFAHVGFDAKRDIAAIILNRWGPRLLESAAWIFLREQREARASRSFAQRPIRADCVREHGFGRRHGPSLLDPGSAPRC
jgi:spermidine dehydrogenase